MKTTRHHSLNGLRRHLRLQRQNGFRLIAYGYEGDKLVLTWRAIDPDLDSVRYLGARS